MFHRLARSILATVLALLSAGPAGADAPSVTIDLATLDTTGGSLLRLYGSTGDGSTGVPVTGGFDCDGDGFADSAMSSMRASPQGRFGAGLVYLLFGDGTISGSFDSAVVQARLLEIHGDGTSEATGSEIWMDDVTGDGLGDLLVARQNFTPDPGRIGAGALTLLVGGPALRDQADALAPLDLRAPSPSVTATTFVGAAALDRLGIWMRTGDVTGDGIADIVVAADQEDSHGEHNSGAAYVIRGGPHLATSQTIDLASFGATALAGHIARVGPPVGAASFHLGATCQIADLDGNLTSEVLLAATLNRAGATIPAAGAPPGSAEGSGGAIDGTVYIAWDDNFVGNPWPAGYTFDLDAAPGTITAIGGGTTNISFGEEILGGRDYDDDGAPDLFVGDLVADASPGQTRPLSGSGYVLYDAPSLKGLSFDLDLPPPGLVTVTFVGPSSGDIAADTAMHGDFDGDGIDDLAFSSPHGSPLGRPDAGILHVFFGRSGPWPSTVDLAAGALPPAAMMRVTEIYGANGTSGSDSGDILCYSGASGDMNGDGKTDILTNEMFGNGILPSAEDVGNMIILNGDSLAQGIESPCEALPNAGCEPAALGKSSLILKSRGGTRDRLKWKWSGATPLADFLDPLGGTTRWELCLWDASGLRTRAAIPAGATCGSLPCWRPAAKGYAYRHPDAAPEGIDRVRLREGDGTQARIVASAKGSLLSLPTLPLDLPVTAQLHAVSATEARCWEAAFGAAKVNTPDKFKARNDSP